MQAAIVKSPKNEIWSVFRPQVFCTTVIDPSHAEVRSETLVIGECLDCGCERRMFLGTNNLVFADLDAELALAALAGQQPIVFSTCFRHRGWPLLKRR